MVPRVEPGAEARPGLLSVDDAGADAGAVAGTYPETDAAADAPADQAARPRFLINYENKRCSPHAALFRVQDALRLGYGQEPWPNNNPD